MSMRAVCAFCASQAYYAVTVPGAAGDRAAGACNRCLATAVERVAQHFTGASVAVYLLDRGMPPQALPHVQDVAEQVRRIGARSVRGGQEGHLLEDRLYLGVLAAIAQGAEEPAGLAMAALMTRNYHFERYT